MTIVAKRTPFSEAKQRTAGQELRDRKPHTLRTWLQTLPGSKGGEADTDIPHPDAPARSALIVCGAAPCGQGPPKRTGKDSFGFIEV